MLVCLSGVGLLLLLGNTAAVAWWTAAVLAWWTAAVLARWTAVVAW